MWRRGRDGHGHGHGRLWRASARIMKTLLPRCQVKVQQPPSQSLPLFRPPAPLHSRNCGQPTLLPPGMQNPIPFHLLTLRSPSLHGLLSSPASPFPSRLLLLPPPSLKLRFLASPPLYLSLSQTGFPTSLQPQLRGLRPFSSPAMASYEFDIPATPETVIQEPRRLVVGSIHLIVGPMFAGKTTALLKRVQSEASSGRRVAMVKSDKDTRYGLKSVVSHSGIQMPCWAVSSLANFRDQIGEEAYAKLDVIGIDEAQFLKDLYRFCKIAADHEGKTIIIAGLDGDFERNRFGSILDLIPIADSVVKLSSHCELCGKPALFTFRKTDEMEKEVIGGTNKYMPVCRQHYFSGKVAMEAARTALDVQKIVSLKYDHMNNKISEVM